MIIAEGARSHACMDVLQQIMITRVGTHEVKREPTYVQLRQRRDSNFLRAEPSGFSGPSSWPLGHAVLATLDVTCKERATRRLMQRLHTAL